MVIAGDIKNEDTKGQIMTEGKEDGEDKYR